MLKLLALAGAAAGAAYLMDKEKGAQRRAELRTKIEPYLNKLDASMASDASDKTSPVSGAVKVARDLLQKVAPRKGLPYDPAI